MFKYITKRGKGILDVGDRQERHCGPLVHLRVYIEKIEEIGPEIEKS